MKSIEGKIESKDYPWRDKEILEELYCNRDNTQKECADILDCGADTISNWAAKHSLTDTVNAEERRKELIGSILRCKEKYGEVTQQLINDDADFPSATTICRYFDGLEEAKLEAGLFSDTRLGNFLLRN